MALHSFARRLAFSLKHQPNASQAVALAAINKMTASQNHAPLTVTSDVVLSDADWRGKGTTFATFQTIEQKTASLPSQQRVLSDLNGLFALRFVMGAVASAQPDAVGDPATWKHTLTWQSVLTDPECVYTTMLEQAGAGTTPGYKRILIGSWVSQVTISAQLGAFINLNFQGGARSYDVSTATLPSDPSLMSIMNVARTEIRMQAWSDPDTPQNPATATIIDGQWISFELNFNNNAQPKLRSGQTVGNEKFVARADVGRQSVTGNIVLENSDTIRALFLNESIVALQITFKSEDLTADDVQKTVKVIIPKLKVESEGHGEEGTTETLTLNIGEGSILKHTATEPITVEIVTDITDDEIGEESNYAQIQSVDDTGSDGPLYITGEDIEISVVWDVPVTVTGNPRLTVTLDSGPVLCTYASGTGTATLVFSYTVGALDQAEATEFIIGAQSIDLNSGTLKDANGDNVELAIAAGVIADVSDRSVNAA